MRLRQLICTTILSLIVVGCGTQNGDDSTKVSSTEQQDSSSALIEYTPGTRRMTRVSADASTFNTHREYRDYIIDHYWDNFDFNADTLVVAYDTIDICQAMAEYVTIIAPEEADSLMRSLMRRAETSRPVLDYFSTITEIVLHDPNSPLRNDEYYIPVLEVLVNSTLLDEYDRMIPAYDLDIALKNRIGRVANDFEYTLRSGTTRSMHDIEAEYLLIMFNNPDCPMCREVMESITTSPMLTELTELGLLKTLAIYPDSDIDAWRNYQKSMPQSWICGYDKNMTITHEHLYDLRAIPSLYLLDSNKRVLVKDGVDIGYIEHIINEQESHND